MLPSRASVPARQAARAVLLANASPAQRLIPLHRKRPQQQRHYAAMRSPTVSRLARSPPKKSQSGPVFSYRDIPPIDVWQGFSAQQGLGDLTPTQCLKAATDYCGLAVHDNTSWQAALKTDYNIDPYTLHYTALPLLVGGMGPTRHLGAHMLLTASRLGYTPSALTLVSIFSRALGRKRLANSSFKDAVTHFDRVLRTEKNPDAFTLQGLLCLQEGQSGATALRYFDQAVHAARSLPPGGAYGGPEPGTRKGPTARKPRWSLERDCHQKRGEILLQQNRQAEAMASFKIAALELNHADGYAELAKLMPQDQPVRAVYLMKAAQAGNFDACGRMALFIANLAARPGARPGTRPGTRRALRYHLALRSLAYEWASIDPDFKKRDELQAQVMEITGELTRSHMSQPNALRRLRMWLWTQG